MVQQMGRNFEKPSYSMSPSVVAKNFLSTVELDKNLEKVVKSGVSRITTMLEEEKHQTYPERTALYRFLTHDYSRDESFPINLDGNNSAIIATMILEEDPKSLINRATANDSMEPIGGIREYLYDALVNDKASLEKTLFSSRRHNREAKELELKLAKINIAFTSLTQTDSSSPDAASLQR